jgi:hypothetical protein
MVSMHQRAGGIGEADYAYFVTKVVPSEADPNAFN